MTLIKGSSLFNINSLIETSQGRPLNQKEGNKLMKYYTTWKRNTLKNLEELGMNGKYDYLLMNFNLGFSLDTYPHCIPGKELDHLKLFDLQLFEIKKGSTNDFELDQLQLIEYQENMNTKNPNIEKNVFKNLKKEQFLVSVPLENEIARLMTPLLFYELRVANKVPDIVRLRSWWKCHDSSFENNNFFIMKDKYTISLKALFKQYLDVRRIPDFQFLWASLKKIFIQFRTLHKSHNGFLHGNLLLENIALTEISKKQNISMINLENSSFYVNGYRFYTPVINDYLHSGIFILINTLFNMEYDAGNKFFKLIQDIPSTGRVGEFAKSILPSLTFGAIGVDLLQDFVSTFIDIPSIGYLDYINMLLVQNNPLFSLPGTYDIYSLICSLFSEDYMYIHVMRPNFKKNGEPKGLVCDDARKRYNIDSDNDTYCPYGNKLVDLWRSIWFPDELQKATKSILEIGKERNPLRNIVEMNRFLLPFKLKVDLSNAFNLFYLREVKKRQKNRNLRIITTENGHICADDSESDGECETSFSNEIKYEKIAKDSSKGWFW
jgi:hypothetical protein